MYKDVIFEIGDISMYEPLVTLSHVDKTLKIGSVEIKLTDQEADEVLRVFSRLEITSKS